MKIKRTVSAVICNIIAWLFSAICFIPLLLIVFNSLKDKKSAASMNLTPPSFPIPWENFSKVIEKGKLWTSFGNSLLYSAGAVILCVFFAALAAFVLSRNQTKINNILYLFLVLGITLPINYVALTNGGPGKATTEVLYTAVFKKFGTGQYAVGTALSSVMFIIMIFVGYYMIKIMTKNEVVE